MEFRFNSGDLQFKASVDGESNFDVAFKSQWNKAVEAGACRYLLTNLRTKILSGKYRHVAQLNPERAKLRRTPQDLQLVDVPFDPSQFNFTRVQDVEILLHLKGEDGDPNNVVIINISPLEFGNSLLVPSVKECIAQRITLPGLTLLMHVMLLSSDANLRSGFNSPGGYASVNHQHFHLYYLPQRLFLETANVEHVAGPCYALTDFPSKGFAFQLDDGNVQSLAKNVHRLVTFLRDRSIAHNLFLTRGRPFVPEANQRTVDDWNTLRVFVWARESTFGVKEEIGFNPAMCELAGHLLIKEELTFDTVDQEQVDCLLDSLTSPYFHQVRPQISNLYADSQSSSTV